MAYKSESILDRDIAPVSFYVAKKLYSMFPVSVGSIFRLLFKKGEMLWAHIFCCHAQPSLLINTYLAAPPVRGKVLSQIRLLNIEGAWDHGFLSRAYLWLLKFKKILKIKDKECLKQQVPSFHHSRSLMCSCLQTQGLVQGSQHCSVKGRRSTIKHHSIKHRH